MRALRLAIAVVTACDFALSVVVMAACDGAVRSPSCSYYSSDESEQEECPSVPSVESPSVMSLEEHGVEEHEASDTDMSTTSESPDKKQKRFAELKVSLQRRHDRGVPAETRGCGEALKAKKRGRSRCRQKDDHWRGETHRKTPQETRERKDREDRVAKHQSQGQRGSRGGGVKPTPRREKPTPQPRRHGSITK